LTTSENAVHSEDVALGSADGTRLHARRWLPPGAPRAVLAIVHGYAEHLGRYEHVAAYFAARGYAVYAVDLRGHGESEGARVRVRSFAEYLDDMDALLGYARAQHPGAPLFVLGHSMGGAIVALSLVTRPADARGFLLSGPVLPNPQASLLKRIGAAVVERIALVIGRIAPGFGLRTLDAAMVSRDPGVVARYDSDPLNYRGKVPAGTVAAMLRAVRAVERRVDRVTQPLLIAHGGADALASPDGSRWLYEHAPSADKTLRIYDGLYHEILNEPEQEQVMAEIASWMDARLAGDERTETASAAG
jgi:alpha-beta hydrolase superfamily lysophospholipase